LNHPTPFDLPIEDEIPLGLFGMKPHLAMFGVLVGLRARLKEIFLTHVFFPYMPFFGPCTFCLRSTYLSSLETDLPTFPFEIDLPSSLIFAIALQ